MLKANNQEQHRGKKKRLLKRNEVRERYDAEIKTCTMKYDHIRPKTCVKFSDLPLSFKTLKGLEEAGFVTLTDIQREAIPHCLKGKDVQAEALTGSGKTLAFLIPVLECLWREKWSPVNGVGALIITPTRELAYQIYEVLKKVGCRHDFSAGLVIGGKSLEDERRSIHRTNIVIATPGRLLQHMDETAAFSCDLLQVLVLDEADRMLDMGFSVAMENILETLPTDRQTLLYSATQSPHITKLARLSLKEPMTVSTNDTRTPIQLSHSYVVLNLQEKVEVLYSFIKSHLNSKILVFMSSCKQVQFHNAVLCKLRPGLPILALYGKQKQLRRVGVYEAFCKKTAAVLLATDIAARGLDIPAVHWVIHLDCPEDVESYIHRSGRTARYHKSGNSLALFLPSEERMVQRLSEEGVTLTPIRVNPQKQVSIQKKIQALCAESPEIHHWARRCFVSYVRSVFLQRDKTVFDVKALPLEAYAASLGMLTAPRVRFLKKAAKQRGGSQIPHENEKIVTEERVKLGCESEQESDDDILTKKTSTLDELSTDNLPPAVPRQLRAKSKVAKAKALLRKGIKANTKLVFDEEGNVVSQEGIFVGNTEIVDITPSLDPEKAGGISISDLKIQMIQQDSEDKKEEKARRKEMKRIRKELRKRSEREAAPPTLGGPVEDIEQDDQPTAKRMKHYSYSDLQDTELLAQQLLGDL